MDAIINLYKPTGMTSFQCVAAVRKILGIKKVGHAGTLDPEASGVLPVCVGKATKLLEFFLLCPKQYQGHVMFGVATDTQDIWGQCLETGDPGNLTEEQVREAASLFTGDIRQLPPIYSAVKVDGVPLYKKARQGMAETAKRTPRTVSVYHLTVGPLGDTCLSAEFGVPVREASLDVTCSRGTYIRTLCYDIGRQLNVPACMSYLCRRAYGPFTLENAVTLEELKDGAKKLFYPPDYILTNFPTITLQEEQLRSCKNGQPTAVNREQLSLGADRPLFPRPETGIAKLCFRNDLIGVVRFYAGTELADGLLTVKPWKYMGGGD